RASKEHIRLSLALRDQREPAYAPRIEHYHCLAPQTVGFKERNQALVTAGGSTARRANATGGAPGAAYLSLETELATAGMEHSERYKLQSRNAQRLLNLTDSLREVQEKRRPEREEMRNLRHEVEGVVEAAKRHSELVVDKKRQLLTSRSGSFARFRGPMRGVYRPVELLLRCNPT
ncbi:SPOSA6832_02510, partial [Sporobolomyces salmonicolor]